MKVDSPLALTQFNVEIHFTDDIRLLMVGNTVDHACSSCALGEFPIRSFSYYGSIHPG